VSGHAGRFRRVDLFSAGFTDFLEKPFSISVLGKALEISSTD